MRRTFSLGLVSLVVVSFLLSFEAHPESQAAPAASAVPASFVVDCSNGTLYNSSLESALGNPLVISAEVGDTFEITAVGTCGVQDSAALSGDGVTFNDGSRVFTVVASPGSFRIDAGSNGGEKTVYLVPCGLDGSGTEADPWRVADQADFQKVGRQATSGESCSLSGHYLQTADIELSAPALDIVGNGTSDTFSGVYDGDHYDLSLTGIGTGGWASGSQAGATYESVLSPFPLVNGGTIKKLRVSGEIRTSEAVVGGLVGRFISGLISEVSSSVNVESSAANAQLGGLVGRISTDTGDVARIQYSRVRNSLEHYKTDGGVSVTTYFGGIAGVIETTTGQTVEIRDSYARSSVTVGLTNQRTINAGGLVGSIESGNPLFVRTYSVFADPAVSCTGTCDTTRNVGGLVGEFQAAINPTFVGNFFVSSTGVSTAVDVLNGSNQPEDYAAGTNLPVAVPVSDSELRRITTFTTEEAVVDGSASGNPGGDTLSASASDGSEDYLWAIEETRVQTFVPSNYDVGAPDDDPGSDGEQNVYTNRVVYSDTTVEKSYPVRTAGDSTATVAALRPLDAFTTTDYPALGRVWEMCDGSDYPWLVWEEVDGCSGGGSGGSNSSSTRNNDDDSIAELAAAAGLTEAEYAAFLASGLTLEQFLASRLAATGTSSTVLVGALLFSLALLIAGGALYSRGRRHRALGQE